MRHFDKDEAISVHLSLAPTSIDGEKYTSTLTAALKDARRITDRNLDTGRVNHARNSDNLNPGMWLGAVGYIIILDQIGSCYRPQHTNRNSPPSNYKDYSLALHHFAEPGLTPQQIDYLYRLRNSFVHDYSLMNRKPNPSKKSKKNKKESGYTNCAVFQLEQSPAGQFIILPNKEWDGDLGKIAPENETRVNLRRLGDVVENVYARLQQLHAENELKLVLSGGPKELILRYTFRENPRPLDDADTRETPAISGISRPDVIELNKTTH